MSYEESTFYRQVGGTWSEWFTAGVAGGGVCVCLCACARVCRVVYSCGGSISGDSILTAQQPKEWREKWAEIDSLGGI